MIALLLRTLTVVGDVARGVRCPACLERHRDLARHVDVDHAGDAASMHSYSRPDLVARRPDRFRRP